MLFKQDDLPQRQPSVGFSDNRTPAKHILYFKFLGKEVGAAPHVAAKWALHHPPCIYPGHCIVELTAGDAVGDGTNSFWRSASPLISCKLVSQQHRMRVRLYEKDAAAFQSLITVLERSLPTIGFKQVTETSWHHSIVNSTVDCFFGDARQLELFNPRPYEWLFVLNDPNNMHGWVLDMERLAKVMSEPQGGGPRFATFMSTMGCNAGGIKMLSPEHRKMWFVHIDQATHIVEMFARLDLILFRILNDASQWAYLLMVPTKWIDFFLLAYCKIFEQQGLTVSSHSWRRDRADFRRAIEELFYSKEERANGRVWKI